MSMGAGDHYSFSSGEDFIDFSYGEQPRLYVAPEVIHLELCRLLGTGGARMEVASPEPLLLENLTHQKQRPLREYEWPIQEWPIGNRSGSA